MDASSDGSGRYLRLRWPTIATASVVVAVGSLGTLVIVASVREADLLSVVALALAILAFVIEIIVFVAQTWASSQQVSHAQSVNAETKALLRELQTQTRDTNAVLTDQYNKLLDRLLLLTKDAGGEVAGGSGGAKVTEVQERLLEEIQRSRPIAESSMLARTPTSRAMDQMGNPREWPPPSVLARVADLGVGNLTEEARAELRVFAVDWDLSLKREIPDGLARDPGDPAVQELVTVGLLIGRTTFADGEQYFELTRSGRAAARLFLAPAPAPAEAIELFPWLKEDRIL